MTDAAFPSKNTANVGNHTGMLTLVLQKFLQGVDDMLPARVVAYNRTTNRAQVQPLISMVTTHNQIVPRANVASIPVLQLGGGGFVLTFPIRAGDLGWIKANDRDISIFKKAYKTNPPNTQRKHSFEDALFIPDVMMSGVTIRAEDATNTVLQNLAATVRMALFSNKLKFTAPRSAFTDQEGYAQDANAVLDVQSTTKAFKLPVMTTGQRDAIPSPHMGFVVWLSNTSPPRMSTYDGSDWS